MKNSVYIFLLSVSIIAAQAQVLTFSSTGFCEVYSVVHDDSKTTLSISGAVANTVTFDGAGAIILDSSLDRLIGSTDHLLVQESGHTIRGAGALGSNLINFVNRGTISADNTSGQLTIDDRTGGMVNEGTLSSFGGGTLSIVDPLAQSGAYSRSMRLALRA